MCSELEKPPTWHMTNIPSGISTSISETTISHPRAWTMRIRYLPNMIQNTIETIRFPC